MKAERLNSGASEDLMRALVAGLVNTTPDGRMRPMLEFTALFRKVPEGYIGYVEELPGANTQGSTLEEARENLREAIRLVVEANRELAAETLGQGEIVRERIAVG